MAIHCGIDETPSVEPPEVEYARSGDVAIAYQVVGDGPVDLVFIVAGVGEVGLELRAALHTGECELHDGKPAGIAVSIGARVAGEARPGEVLVSSTVKDLVAGSGIAFEDRGVHALKGIPGEWQLYAAREPTGSSLR